MAIDGRKVRKGIDYDITLIDRQPGDSLRLSLQRDGRPVEAELVLESRPAPDGEMLAREKLGLGVYPVPEDVAADLWLQQSTGLLITEVQEGSPADEAGLQRRDILLAIDRHYVATTEDLGRLLELRDPGDVITVRVLRISRRGKLQLAGPLRIR